MSLNVPGLFLFDSFFSNSECEELVDSSLLIHQGLESKHDQQALTPANIPQPELVKRADHNLSTHKSFSRISVQDTTGCECHSEYFPHYGDKGHSLAYFRGTDNIPSFIKHLTPRIQSLLLAKNILKQDVKGRWRLTMNFYKNRSGTLSGFPFHVDIPANGIITMILNIHREVTFQITNDKDMLDIRLSLGALLILSGDSRYKWKHRVMPCKGTSKVENHVERVSLVLGVK